jgi:hypothetical protein
MFLLEIILVDSNLAPKLGACFYCRGKKLGVPKIVKSVLMINIQSPINI